MTQASESKLHQPMNLQ